MADPSGWLAALLTAVKSSSVVDRGSIELPRTGESVSTPQPTRAVLLAPGLEPFLEPSEVRPQSSSDHTGKQPPHQPIQSEFVLDLCCFSKGFAMQQPIRSNWSSGGVEFLAVGRFMPRDLEGYAEFSAEESPDLDAMPPDANISVHQGLGPQQVWLPFLMSTGVG